MEDFHRDSEGDFLLDEDGDPIPLSICICSAWYASECGCECDSWGDHEEDE